MCSRGTTYIGMGIIEKIVELLAIEDMKQSVLSRKTGISEAEISRWKNPRVKLTYPIPEETLKIARVLGVSMEFLADDEKTIEALEADLLEQKILEKARTIGLATTMRMLEPPLPHFLGPDELRKRKADG